MSEQFHAKMHQHCSKNCCSIVATYRSTRFERDLLQQATINRGIEQMIEIDIPCQNARETKESAQTVGFYIGFKTSPLPSPPQVYVFGFENKECRGAATFTEMQKWRNAISKQFTKKKVVKDLMPVISIEQGVNGTRETDLLESA